MISHPWAPTTTSCRRKIRYKSPEGRVFHSRGPLIRFSIPSTFSHKLKSLTCDRYLYENNLKKKQQLKTLKRLLKTNQGLRFEESRRNDRWWIFFPTFKTSTKSSRFIKHLDVDWNFLLFLRQRYDNHVDLPEVWYMHLYWAFGLQCNLAARIQHYN